MRHMKIHAGGKSLYFEWPNYRSYKPGGTLPVLHHHVVHQIVILTAVQFVHTTHLILQDTLCQIMHCFKLITQQDSYGVVCLEWPKILEFLLF